MIAPGVIVKRPRAQHTRLLIIGNIRFHVLQPTPERVNLRQFLASPETPCPSDKGTEKRQSKERSIDVGHEEGLGICIIGEDGLFGIQMLGSMSLL